MFVVFACTLTQSTVADEASTDDHVSSRGTHWAFQPIQRPRFPSVNDTNWVSDPLDRFVLAGLESENFSPNSPAEKRVLLRRVTYDLIGLPPTPAEIEAFVGDTSEGAFATVVDRLLASPHYGERQARHWLDLVRFAETTGHEYDFDIPYAWRYRDFVIRAFNDDVPYDQFVTEHIAGDLIETPRLNPSTGGNESILGTTFFWLGQEKSAPVDLRAAECDRIDDQIDVVSRVFLGLSVSCARCHDHKFDPVTIEDYYALAGYLKSSRRQITRVDSSAPTREIIAKVSHKKSAVDGLLKAELHDLGRQPQSVASNLQRPVLAGAGEGVRYASVVAGMLLLIGFVQLGTSHSVRKKILVGVGSAVVVICVIGLTMNRLSNSAHHPQHGGNGEFLSQSAVKFADGFGILSRANSPEKFTRAKDAIVDQLEAIREQAAGRPGDVVFEDFQDGTYRRWSVTGEAFGTSPTQPGEFLIGTSVDRPIERFLKPGIAHSGLQSGKLRGTLRSGDFQVATDFIHYRIARKSPPEDNHSEPHAEGSEADQLDTGAKPGQVHLIIDGLSKNLIFSDEASVDADEGEKLTWYQQEIEDAWKGRRAYIEIDDADDGYVAVDRIVFSNNPVPPPDVPGEYLTELLDDPAIDSLPRLVEAIEGLFTETVELWASSNLAQASDPADSVTILNWLFENGLSQHLLANGTEPNLQRRLKQLLDETQKLEGEIQRPQLALTTADGSPHNEVLLSRGDHLAPDHEVPRRWPAFLAGNSDVVPPTGSGRLDLARWLTDADNPLFARVMVNRIWQQHFGEGLVRTPDDFGMMGEPPTHPELLEYLAYEFRTNGFSVKALKRRMLMSSTYRMSSVMNDPQVEAADPDNRTLHRMPLRRLEAEAIRDAILAVSGRLDRRLYGPGVAPHLTPFMDGRGKPDYSGPLDGGGRRSIYITVRRNFLPPLLTAFGFPVPDSPRGKRVATNVPAQALTMMNSEFVREQATTWAERTLSDKSLSSAESRIRRLYEAAYGRPPSVDETEEALGFLGDDLSEVETLSDTATWSDLCHVLFNGTEFLYVR